MRISPSVKFRRGSVCVDCSLRAGSHHAYLIVGVALPAWRRPLEASAFDGCFAASWRVLTVAGYAR